jgi:type IV fimbrial biogenesis protein FimT
MPGICSGSGGWEQGWIIFHDANNNAALDAGEALLMSEPALPGRLRLTGNAQLASDLSYTPSGSASLVSGAFQAGTLTMCVDSEAPMAARQIVISATGRPRTAKVMLDRCI